MRRACLQLHSYTCKADSRPSVCLKSEGEKPRAIATSAKDATMSAVKAAFVDRNSHKYNSNEYNQSTPAGSLHDGLRTELDWRSQRLLGRGCSFVCTYKLTTQTHKRARKGRACVGVHMLFQCYTMCSPVRQKTPLSSTIGKLAAKYLPGATPLHGNLVRLEMQTKNARESHFADGVCAECAK